MILRALFPETKSVVRLLPLLYLALPEHFTGLLDHFGLLRGRVRSATLRSLVSHLGPAMVLPHMQVLCREFLLFECFLHFLGSRCTHFGITVT